MLGRIAARGYNSYSQHAKNIAKPYLVAASLATITSLSIYLSNEIQAESEIKFGVALKDKYKYVIVGAGAAGYAALQEISEADPKAAVLMLSTEAHLPYSRPALSKDLWDEAVSNPNVGKTMTWRKNSKVTHVTLVSEGEWKARFPNVTLAVNTEAKDLNVESQVITLENGKTVQYEKCLLATGARPNKIKVPGGDIDPDRVISFRNLEDFQKLEEKSAAGLDMVVCGGGFLGTELSSALNKRSKKNQMNLTPRKGKKQRSVTQVVPEPGVLYRFLPRYLSDFVANKLSTSGVDMRANTLVTGLEKDKDGNLTVELTVRTLGNLRTGPSSSIRHWADVRKYTLKSDIVVVAVGVTPNTDLAEKAGLEIDNIRGGIMSDSKLEVGKNIYAAGDCVCYYDNVLGRRRMEHWDHAVETGRVAGRNMAGVNGGKNQFSHLSMFWSDLLDLDVHFEGVGNVRSDLSTVGFWDIDRRKYEATVEGVPDFEVMEYNKGIVYYLEKKTNKVIGVVLWNIPEKMEEARAVIAKGTNADDLLALRSAIPVEDARLRDIMTS